MTSNASGTSLREQLGGSPDPDFEVKLPSGWERLPPDETTRQRFDAALKKRLMEAHRPDVYAQARTMLQESFKAMQTEGAVALYAATQDAEDTLWLPGSIIASVRRPPTGGTLDDLVRHAIREYGAAPLFGDKRFVRFEREKKVDVENSAIIQTSIIYLTPIPGSGRRRGLQFNATFGRSVDVDENDSRISAYKATFDLIVSTLRWTPPTS